MVDSKVVGLRRKSIIWRYKFEITSHFVVLLVCMSLIKNILCTEEKRYF